MDGLIKLLQHLGRARMSHLIPKGRDQIDQEDGDALRTTGPGRMHSLVIMETDIHCPLGPWCLECAERGVGQADCVVRIGPFQLLMLRFCFYFPLDFIAFSLMLFSFQDSIPRQNYGTSPAVVSGRKILIPFRLNWREEMDLVWFSPKLFKAVILNRGGFRKSAFHFAKGRDI